MSKKENETNKEELELQEISIDEVTASVVDNTDEKPFIKVNNIKFLGIKLPTIYGELQLVDITDGEFAFEPEENSGCTKTRYSFYFESSADENTKGFITTIKDFIGLFNLTSETDITAITDWILKDPNIKLIFANHDEETPLGFVPFYIVQIRDNTVPEDYYDSGIAVANNFAKLSNICVNRYNDEYYLGQADKIADILRNTTYIDDKGALKKINVTLCEKLLNAVKDKLFIS